MSSHHVHTCQMLSPGDGKPCRHYIRPDNPGEPGFCQQATRFFCIEAMKRKLPAIAYSHLSDFISCKLRYYHSVIQGLQVRPKCLPEAMKLGKGWGSFIRHLYDGTDYQAEIQSLELSPEQQAKLSALMRAYQDLEIQTNTDGLLGCEYQIHVPVGQNQIIGYINRAYEDHIKEIKLSTRPDFYTQKENISYQLGTYLMGNDHWEYADMEIARVPGLKTGWGKFADEGSQGYEERLYGDILSRPAFYFLGWDRKARTYGVRFWRSEFDLDETFSIFAYVLREIKDTLERGAWYPNNLSCYVPTPCVFLPIKRSGVTSDQIFEKRQINGGSEK